MAGPRTGGSALRTVVLIVATLTTGLSAGVFTDWSNTIMPGLSAVDDRTFVLAFRELDAAILNPLFLGLELAGGLVFTAVSIGLHLREPWRAALPWTSIALLCFLVVFVITFALHEPLNERIRTAEGLRSGADFAYARAQLDEALWTTWNHARALASTLAFGFLCAALVAHGRAAAKVVASAAGSASAGEA